MTKRCEAKELRQQGLSINAIAKKVGASKSSVSVWTRDVKVSDEHKDKLNDARKAVGLKNVLSRNAQCRIDRSNAREEGKNINIDDALITAGLALYWAEGKKKSDFVSLVNTDAELIKLFVRFMTNRMSVDRTDIIFRVVIHDGNDSQLAERHWQKVLNLPEENRRKTTVIKSGKKNGKQNRHPQGMCVVDVYNVVLFEKIMGGIDRLKTGSWSIGCTPPR